MRAGDVVEGRFTVLQPVGSGGMGTVFRGQDRVSGADVAIKVLRDADDVHAHRFEREAELLSGLRHPGIVRYVAHGRTAELESFLVMEWLEGEDLGRRLERAGLSAADAVRLMKRTAAALAVAHAQGIVHRDLKPPNLFLVGGDVDRVKLLDFGVARVTVMGRQATQLGTVLGTPGYMSPEQARGTAGVDARADIFSLGCVLFETVTGRPAFQGANLMALLAKILLEDAPHLRELRPELPEPLDALVAAMLAKDPAGRPADGAALAQRLDALGTIDDSAPAPARPRAQAITTGERRLLCVILAGGSGPRTSGIEPTFVSSPALWSSPTLSSGEQRLPLGQILTIAAAHGGLVEQLADGSLVVTLAGVKVATDQAARAARCALALRELMPEKSLALATGRGVVSDRWPLGEVIDRAAILLRAATTPNPGGPPPIRIDEVSARLLGSRFEVQSGPSCLELRRELADGEVGRKLLGKATPLVGRDRELAALKAIYAECVEEPVARAVVVTAPPGGGKTRLREELVAAIRRAEPPAQVWTALGDPLSAGAAFGLLAQALRTAADLRLADPPERRQRALRAWLGRRLAGDDLERCCEFLAELTGCPFPDEKSVQLRAARRDSMLMGDQMRRALEDLLRAECAAGPLALILEDLQWGDLPTVRLLDSALRTNAERPFFVLALARPEVEQQFPALWADRGAQPIPLGALTRKACERLIRAVLGEAVEPAVLGRLVELSEGNALYLEELIRAAGEGKGQALPETVVAMLEARLEGLEDEARRLLRAASVFGRVFWRGGIKALLGDLQRTSMTADWLDRLVELELVSQNSQSRFPEEEEYTFRHALVVDAAYAMLTERDRELAHKLAGEWLERAGEGEPLILAQHFDLGGEPLRAVAWFSRSAQQALEGNDLAAVLARAERGVACGATGAALGTLRLLEAEAHQWRGEHGEALALALEAMGLLPAASRPWFQAACEVAIAAHRVNDTARLDELQISLPQAATQAGAAGPFVIAASRLIWGLFTRGQNAAGMALLAAIERAEAAGAGSEPAEAAAIQLAHSTQTMLAGDTGGWLEHEKQTLACYLQAGDLRHACEEHGNLGYAYASLGAFEEAVVELRRALAEAARLGLSTVRSTAKQNLALTLINLGELDEGGRLLRESIEEFAAFGDRRMEGASRDFLVRLSVRRGDLATAERELATALRELAEIPPQLAHAQAVLAELRLAQGRPQEARAAAKQGMALLVQLGQIEDGEVFIEQMEIETAQAVGEQARAREVLAQALARLADRASRIRDPTLRASFLERVPEHARLKALAELWRAPQT